MGISKRTSEEDYRHYARPEPGADQSWVYVTDDGSGREQPVETGLPSGAYYGSPGNPEPAGTENSVAVPSPPLAAVPEVRSRNLSLWAAWAVVALMLAVGLGWLSGFIASPWDEYYGQASGTPQTQPQELRLNLYTLGPYVTAAGLLGAVILLAVQAVLHHRRNAGPV